MLNRRFCSLSNHVSKFLSYYEVVLKSFQPDQEWIPKKYPTLGHMVRFWVRGWSVKFKHRFQCLCYGVSLGIVFSLFP